MKSIVVNRTSFTLACSIRVVTTTCLLVLFLLLHLPAQAAAPNANAYKIGPHDILKVSVYQSPDLNLEAQVSDGGLLNFPLIGHIQAAGLTASQLEQAIEERLVDGKFIRNPQVTVIVSSYRSRIVTVIGQVAKPGRYAIDTGHLRLSELIALAGGILPTGSESATILRDTQDGVKRITVDLVQIFAGDDNVVADFEMKAGDRVFVDRAPTFFIRGEVQRPGAYPIPGRLTIGQAIAIGGGVTQRGNEKSVKVFRIGKDASRREVAADRGASVLPNDEIVVGEKIF